MVIRGSAMYLFLFVLFRVVIRRRLGSIGMADILVIVIIADAAQNGMSGDYRSVTEGAILVGTIVALNVFTDWLTYISPRLQKILEPPPLLLIDRGRLIRRNMRIEFVSEDELRAKLREHGLTEYRQVEKAYLETEGELSVIKRQAHGA
jgi:uncharacterized membrane protein YcaP (DUF421 family)